MDHFFPYGLITDVLQGSPDLSLCFFRFLSMVSSQWFRVFYPSSFLVVPEKNLFVYFFPHNYIHTQLILPFVRVIIDPY